MLCSVAAGVANAIALLLVRYTSLRTDRLSKAFRDDFQISIHGHRYSVASMIIDIICWNKLHLFLNEHTGVEMSAFVKGICKKHR